MRGPAATHGQGVLRDGVECELIFCSGPSFFESVRREFGGPLHLRVPGAHAIGHGVRAGTSWRTATGKVGTLVRAAHMERRYGGAIVKAPSAVVRLLQPWSAAPRNHFLA